MLSPCLAILLSLNFSLLLYSRRTDVTLQRFCWMFKYVSLTFCFFSPLKNGSNFILLKAFLLTDEGKTKLDVVLISLLCAVGLRLVGGRYGGILALNLASSRAWWKSTVGVILCRSVMTYVGCNGWRFAMSCPQLIFTGVWWRSYLQIFPLSVLSVFLYTARFGSSALQL